MTTFKNAPKKIPLETTEKIRLHTDSYYVESIDPQKETITVEPMANHIHREITGKKCDKDT